MSATADDIHAIATLKARYCLAVDAAAQDHAASLAALTALLLPDAVGDYGGVPLVGAGAIGAFLCGSIADGSAWALHMIHTPLIAIDGDAATGEWTVMVHLKRLAGGHVDIVVGRYADSFRRTPAGWRIATIGFAQMR